MIQFEFATSQQIILGCKGLFWAGYALEDAYHDGNNRIAREIIACASLFATPNRGPFTAWPDRWAEYARCRMAF